MKRLLLALALVALTLPASAFRDPICYQNASGLPTEVSSTNKLPVDAVVTIATVAAEINLPRDAANTPYFSLSQVASDALTLFNAWFAAANLDKLASTSEGLKVVATGVVRVSEIPAITGSVSVDNYPDWLANATATEEGLCVVATGQVRVTELPAVTGTVDVGNFPAVQVASLPDGVAVNSLPAVTGAVSISGQSAASLTVHVDNMPSTQTVSLAPASAFTQSALSAEATAASYTTGAGCESVSLFNLASTTIWFSLDGAGATVSMGIPLTATNTMQQQQSFSCGPNETIWYIASNSSAFTLLESGR